jgi:hypothetical protein
MLETTEKTLCNILLEVDARVLINDLLSQIFRKLIITDTEHIVSETVVQKFHLERLVKVSSLDSNLLFNISTELRRFHAPDFIGHSNSTG